MLSMNLKNLHSHVLLHHQHSSTGVSAHQIFHGAPHMNKWVTNIENLTDQQLSHAKDNLYCVITGPKEYNILSTISNYTIDTAEYRYKVLYMFQSRPYCEPSMTLIATTAHLRLIAGHGVTPPVAGSEALTMGTRLTTENASLSRAARLMN